MVEGGRNLEEEIMESFFEEIDRDDSISKSTLEGLRELDEQAALTDSDSVIAVAKEGEEHVHTED